MVKDQRAGRAKWSRDKEQGWREVIEEQRRNGQSVREFCRGRGLKEASFYRWRQVIGRRDAEVVRADTSSARMTALASVVMIDGPSDDAKSSAVSTAIEIVLCGGTMVRVPRDSTSEQLGMVLDVLERSRC
jgi:hypothetical protein